MVSLQTIFFLTEGLFGIPVNFIFPNMPGHTCLQPDNNYYFCSGPTSVDPICPLPRHGHGVEPEVGRDAGLHEGGVGIRQMGSTLMGSLRISWFLIDLLVLPLNMIC